MGSIWLTTLPDALAGLGNVTVYDGWETRCRRSGGYDALMGVVVHHTASTASAYSDTKYMWENATTRPVGAIYLARNGQVIIGAAGATNCAGAGGPITTSKGTIAKDTANSRTISIEAANNGTGEPWPKIQQDTYVALVAALCDHYGFDPKRDVLAHAEWSPGRKIDPAGDSRWAKGAATWNMDLFRSDVAGSQPTPEPVPPGPPAPLEEDHMLGLVRLDSNPNAIYIVDGVHARKVRSDEVDELTSNLKNNTGFRYHDLTTAERLQIRDINQIPKRSDDQIQLYGIETAESTTQP